MSAEEPWPTLTTEQDATWRAVAEHWQTHEIGPTRRWLMTRRDKHSSSTIDHQLRNLARLGYVRLVEGRAGGIVLLRRPREGS